MNGTLNGEMEMEIKNITENNLLEYFISINLFRTEKS